LGRYRMPRADPSHRQDSGRLPYGVAGRAMNQGALKVALEAIRRRDRFEREVTDLLNAKGFEPGPVIEYLKGRKFLDDARVARVEVERLAKKHRGADRILIELTQRGAPEEFVQAALDEVEISPAAALREKFGGEIDQAKAWRFLRARGFDEEAIARAFAELELSVD
jgi:SOS response regulatory protein OraA/RecX